MREANEFGAVLRRIRKVHKDSLYTLADKLHVSAAFLSTMEIGKKAIPVSYAETISEIYSLEEYDVIELKDAIDKANGKVTISLEGLEDYKKDIVLKFARSVKELDPQSLLEIKRVLNS